MPFLNINGSVVHLAISPCYKFKGFVFEVHSYLGPTKLRHTDHEPAARTGRKFWSVFKEWSELTPEQKESTRI